MSTLFEFDPDDLDEDTLERLAEMTDEDLAQYLDDPEAEFDDDADDELDDAPAEPTREDVYNEPDDPLAGIPKNPARGPRPVDPYRGVDILPPL